MARKNNLPRYYKKFRWMIDITEKAHHPEYHRYGARGQTCAWTNGEYHDFENWLVNTLGHQPTPDHQLCRIDKTGNFEPKNLAWMLPKERSNTGTQQNIFVRHQRKNLSIADWSRELGVPYWTLRRRIAKGQKLSDVIKEFS